MKKLIVLMALVAMIVAVSCDKRTPYYIAMLKPIVEVSDLSIDVTLSDKATDADEVITDKTYNFEITDKKKDVIWKITGIGLSTATEFYAKAVTPNSTTNPTTGEIDMFTLGDVAINFQYDASEETFVTAEELAAQADLVKKSTDISIGFKKASDNTINTANNADKTKSKGYITAAGKIEGTANRVSISLETQDGTSATVYAKVTCAVTGDSTLWIKPVAD